MHLLRYISLLCVLLLPSLAGAGSVRTWTDQQGRELEAEFVRVYQGHAIFMKQGKILRVPLANLSKADQAIALAGGEVPEAATSEDSTSSLGLPRQWLDREGNQIVAQFARYEAGQVVLFSAGQERGFPLEDFSADDQDYVQEHLVSLGQHDQVAEFESLLLAQRKATETPVATVPSNPGGRTSGGQSPGTQYASNSSSSRGSTGGQSRTAHQPYRPPQPRVASAAGYEQELLNSARSRSSRNSSVSLPTAQDYNELIERRHPSLQKPPSSTSPSTPTSPPAGYNSSTSSSKSSLFPGFWTLLAVIKVMFWIALYCNRQKND